MNKFSGLWKRLKSIKHIEIIIAVLFALIVLLVYFSTTSSLGSAKTQNLSLGASYATQVEAKLENLLSKIDGAGKIDVMIMCESEGVQTEDQIPNIKSAVVVASGASDVFVRLEIIKAVEALLKIDAKNIEVLKGAP